MDKTFEQLKTQVIDLCDVANNSSCQNVFNEFKVKYRTLKGLFLASRENFWERTTREIKVTLFCVW